MNTSDTALGWARARALGPARHEVGTPAPDGFLRLLEPDASGVWLLPAHPGPAGPWVLDELGLNGPTVEQPNDTARMLAAVVRCCWIDPEAAIWPGPDADWDAVMSVYRKFGDRDEPVVHRTATGAIRRLHSAAWVLWDEDRRVVRLGPRCGLWENADLTVLRELYRTLPAPDEMAGEMDGIEDAGEPGPDGVGDTGGPGPDRMEDAGEPGSVGAGDAGEEELDA